MSKSKNTKYETSISELPLKGKVIEKITYPESQQGLTFHFSNGGILKMEHRQNCCESVQLNPIHPHLLEKLLHSPIIEATEEIKKASDHTKTIYKIKTKNWELGFSWHGESNGYYSELPTFTVDAQATIENWIENHSSNKSIIDFLKEYDFVKYYEEDEGYVLYLNRETNINWYKDEIFQFFSSL